MTVPPTACTVHGQKARGGWDTLLLQSLREVMVSLASSVMFSDQFY